MKEEILLISELIKLNMDEIRDESYYKVYWTERHKENNSIGFTTGREIKGWKALTEEWHKIETDLMWGNYDNKIL